MNQTIDFQLNGKAARVETDPSRRLLWVLRTDLALTGTKFGCGIGLCGACTVLVDKKALRSCRLTLADIKGKEVTTIEGLAQGGQLHPVQQAFVDHDAMQCGFCTPGMILNAFSLLLANPNPSEGEVISEMDGNFCRCGAHPRIMKAIMSAAQTMKGTVEQAGSAKRDG
ncbi:MAG: (2Fe-2S)-binding protein [Verrucomicrobia bacterium]|nr:(2Fe-2S)-binding protein [Verrucomicrobiota bacterium]